MLTAQRDDSAAPDDDAALDMIADSPFETAEPPSAVDLGVDIAGLPPVRARLVRLMAWIEQARAECRDLEAGRARFLEESGVPAVTEEKIKTLIESDTMGFVSWMRSGAKAPSRKEVRAFERDELEKKLGDDRHAAEVAKRALDVVEAEIAAKALQIDILEDRKRAFVYDAVVEHAEAIGAEYLRHIDGMRDALLQLNGLAAVIGAHRKYRRTGAPADILIELPGFGLDTLADRKSTMGVIIQPWGPDGEAAARTWRELVKRWTSDPRAPGIVDGVAPELRSTRQTAVKKEPAVVNTPSFHDQLRADLQDAVDSFTVSYAKDDWSERATGIASLVEELRAAAAGGKVEFSDADMGQLVAAIIEGSEVGAIECVPQARVYAFSANASDWATAKAWFKEHPKDAPRPGVDIVTTLGGA